MNDHSIDYGGRVGRFVLFESQEQFAPEINSQAAAAVDAVLQLQSDLATIAKCADAWSNVKTLWLQRAAAAVGQRITPP